MRNVILTSNKSQTVKTIITGGASVKLMGVLQATSSSHPCLSWVETAGFSGTISRWLVQNARGGKRSRPLRREHDTTPSLLTLTHIETLTVQLVSQRALSNYTNLFHGSVLEVTLATSLHCFHCMHNVVYHGVVQGLNSLSANYVYLQRQY